MIVTLTFFGIFIILIVVAVVSCWEDIEEFVQAASYDPLDPRSVEDSLRRSAEYKARKAARRNG